MKRVLLVLVCAAVVTADYRGDGLNFRGFLPSSSFMEDQLAEPSSARVERSHEERERARDERDRDSQGERTQRFGISGYGTTGGTQYGSSAPGLYGPVKIDLGGVLVGTILGFGAVLILPKLIHALSYGYGGGGYGRSLETDISQMSVMLNKIDETLARYNIDSSACTQRLTCSYVQLANENMVAGNATDFDALLSSLSTNSLIRRMLDGTSIYEAVSAGRSIDTDCQTLYPKCKMDKKTVVKILTQLVPS